MATTKSAPAACSAKLRGDLPIVSTRSTSESAPEVWSIEKTTMVFSAPRLVAKRSFPEGWTAISAAFCPGAPTPATAVGTRPTNESVPAEASNAIVEIVAMTLR